MTEGFLYQQSEIFVVLALFVLLLLAGEAGFLLGRRTRDDTAGAIRSQIGTIEGGILALLGLLLGFTFSMALDRFDTRKRMAVDEANAIGTAALRGQMLPQPQRAEVADLFRRYVDARVEVRQIRQYTSDLEDSDAKAGRLQEQLWARAVAGAAKDPRAIPTGLFIQALNDVIDSKERRTAAQENHVPQSVMLLLFVVAAVAVGGVGYGCGLHSKRAIIANVALSSLIAVVVLIIVDLDRPREGLIRVGDKNMIELRDSLSKPKPT